MIATLINRLVGLADAMLLRTLGRAEYERGYRNSLSHRVFTLGGTHERLADADILAINAKTGPLLTHVSIMIAAIAVIVSTQRLGAFKIAIFGCEIVAYLLLAVSCLRCIDYQDSPLTGTNYKMTEHSSDFSESAIQEALIKVAWFTVANRATIALTLFLLASTPVILLA
jgi:hypothetical protein